MKKPLKVLSIDWDYFVNATEEQRIVDFPDPNDNLGLEINKILWMNRYAENPRLTNIGVTINEYSELKQYLMSLRQNKLSEKAKVMVTNSHKHIYDFILNEMRNSYEGVVPIRMFHIDYHTDFYGMKNCDGSIRDVDCGNWLNYLCKDLKGRELKFSKVQWLKRADSERYPDMPKIMSGITYDATSDDLEDMISSFFYGKAPDLIFLCKSIPWSPPHLDSKFDELAECVKEASSSHGYWCTNDIQNRYTEGFKVAVEEQRKSCESLRVRFLQDYGG